MNVCYRVELDEAERGELRELLSGGEHPVRKLKRAQILLTADGGAMDEEIARMSGWASPLSRPERASGMTASPTPPSRDT